MAIPRTVDRSAPCRVWLEDGRRPAIEEHQQGITRPALKATIEHYATLLRDRHRPEQAAQVEIRVKALPDQRKPGSPAQTPAP